MNAIKRVSKKNATILIVDDASSNREILQEILEGEGYKTLSVVNGHFALIFAENHRPDLILLDIMMPGMDGYEVCRELKKNHRTKDIPVIFISALDNTRDIVKALNSGGVDYITKPYLEEEIISRVATHLRLIKQKAIIDKQKAKLRKLQEVINEMRKG
jgi:PleD family two-component response regulator